MNITIKDTDLLKEETDAIVNTVNCVGVMGKGIALQFKQKWPENFKAYQKACKSGIVRPGKMFVYEVDPLFGHPRYIVNFPTKDHWREKSKLSYIEDGLKDLIEFISTNSIRSISIPPLGCGNGGLKWNEVKKLIEQYLGAAAQPIEVHLFEPKNESLDDNMEIRTKKPNMTIGRAVLIKLLSIYNQMRYPLSKLEVQKLCYFAQVSGEDLNLNFAKNKYGPYADNLRHVLNCMNGHYLTGVGDGDKIEAKILLVDGALEEAELFLNKSYSDSINRINMVAELIDGFETPYGMELLSTVHWIAVNDDSKNLQLSDVINGVYNWQPGKPVWNNRKKSIMNERHIAIALEHLAKAGYI